jgi:hypothetical protein
MAHLTLQLGGPIVVPFGIAALSCRSVDTMNWKVRSWREAYASYAGLPVGRSKPDRRAAPDGLPSLVALNADTSDRNET